MKVWVLTREINEYDQDGAYFVAVFKEKPSREQLAAATDTTPDGETVSNLLQNGGGRIEHEYAWFYLTEEDAL